MPYSTRNGLRIHYEVHGDGPPMVLIHANPFDRRLWMFQVAQVLALLPGDRGGPARLRPVRQARRARSPSPT